MELLREQCGAHQHYPKQLDLDSKNLNDYFARLQARVSSLFCEPEDALLEVLDLEGGEREFILRDAETFSEIQRLCPLPSNGATAESEASLRCRFIFLYGENSRSKLYVTHDLVSYILTYHQVQPWFLDFLFAFGKQEVPQDFRFSSFRRIHHNSSKLAIPKLGRSGQDYHMCYNLKSVERTSTNPHMPWSLRQTVVYHSYDTLKGQAFWIILKGNDSLRGDLEQSVQKRQSQGQDSYSTMGQSFAATIQIHLEICDWSMQGWRWYINDLESKLDQLTEHGVTFDIFGAKDPLRSLVPGSGACQKLNYDKFFQFSNLQEAQHVEEKASKALLALKSNASNIDALKSHYTSASSVQGNGYMVNPCLADFYAKLDEMSSELDMHQSALQALVRLVTDRKQLLFGILEYENMVATRTFATKAQTSAENMEKLTKQTKRETVSMKVITLVTMFFLPATFISTLMSTDIIRWQLDNDGTFQKSVSWGAVRFFLALSLPLTFTTFITWAIVYAVILYQERRQEKRLQGYGKADVWYHPLPRMSWPIDVS